MNERTEQSRKSLLTQLRAASQSAARELVDIYHERIYLFLRRLGHSRQVSEDLTQESFIQAWEHIGQLRSPAAMVATVAYVDELFVCAVGSVTEAWLPDDVSWSRTESLTEDLTETTDQSIAGVESTTHTTGEVASRGPVERLVEAACNHQMIRMGSVSSGSGRNSSSSSFSKG